MPAARAKETQLLAAGSCPALTPDNCSAWNGPVLSLPLNRRSGIHSPGFLPTPLRDGFLSRNRVWNIWIYRRFFMAHGNSPLILFKPVFICLLKVKKPQATRRRQSVMEGHLAETWLGILRLFRLLMGCNVIDDELDGSV
jgi:hypothetical protein